MHQIGRQKKSKTVRWRDEWRGIPLINNITWMLLPIPLAPFTENFSCHGFVWIFRRRLTASFTKPVLNGRKISRMRGVEVKREENVAQIKEHKIRCVIKHPPSPPRSIAFLFSFYPGKLALRLTAIVAAHQRLVSLAGRLNYGEFSALLSIYCVLACHR